MPPTLPPLLRRLLRKARLLPPPPPTPLQATDTLWLYDNTAFPSVAAPSGWAAEFISAYFLAHSGRDVARLVADIAEKIGLVRGGDPAAEARIAERVQPFLDVVLEGRTVQLDFAGRGAVQLGPSAGRGVAVNTLHIPGEGYRDGDVEMAVAELPAGIDLAPQISTMTTRFVGSDGWAVVSGPSPPLVPLLVPRSSPPRPASPPLVPPLLPLPPSSPLSPPRPSNSDGRKVDRRKTDIDDTIKVSRVRDRKELLRHTFALEPEAVAQMPRLYGRLHDALRQPAWFYLSASPYNLLPMLHSFVTAHYPPGPLLLREMTVQELDGFVASITVGTQQYKERELSRLVGTLLPRRRWLLLGDSAQRDPEAYAAVYRRHPDRVHYIWIRLVEGVSPLHELRLNAARRFADAFAGVPPHVWRTFRNPDELDALVNNIV